MASGVRPAAPCELRADARSTDARRSLASPLSVRCSRKGCGERTLSRFARAVEPSLFATTSAVQIGLGAARWKHTARKRSSVLSISLRSRIARAFQCPLCVVDRGSQRCQHSLRAGHVHVSTSACARSRVQATISPRSPTRARQLAFRSPHRRHNPYTRSSCTRRATIAGRRRCDAPTAASRCCDTHQAIISCHPMASLRSHLNASCVSLPLIAHTRSLAMR